MSDCIDHGCKGFGLGYASAWYKGSWTTKHRKVLMLATGRTPDSVAGLVARHVCHNPRCINPDHLVWGTQSDNMRDMREAGRAPSSEALSRAGEINGRCILSDVQCVEIRELYVKGSKVYGLRALAERYGVGISQIHRVVTWQQRRDV